MTGTTFCHSIQIMESYTIYGAYTMSVFSGGHRISQEKMERYRRRARQRLESRRPARRSPPPRAPRARHRNQDDSRPRPAVPVAEEDCGGGMGGYECEFVEPPPDELICLICMFVARQPHQLDCCGRVFCKTCLDRNNATDNPCPNCRGRGKDFIDRRSERNILSLKVKCTNAGKGCRWQEELRSLNSHLGVCGFALVPCPNKCTRDGNELQQVLRKDLKHHMQVECSNRMYTCPHCGLEGEYTKMTTSHLERCPLLPVPCPNGCGESVKQVSLQKHRSECPNEEVKCKYAELGCEVKGPRKDTKLHETNEKDLHLSLAMETALQLKHFKQQQVVANPASNLVFKMAPFNHYKSSGKSWYSAPFYSHPGGYKMCISVDANGNNDGEGTHISVWVHFMRGENDGDLKWPFKGSVEVQLLNQLQDKLHPKQSQTYDDDDEEDESNGRVVAGDIGEGSGWSKFIHHDCLHIYLNDECQYLKDDCLYFRISDVKMNEHKPWLAYTT